MATRHPYLVSYERRAGDSVAAALNLNVEYC
jgi:hypothetical protein